MEAANSVASCSNSVKDLFWRRINTAVHYTSASIEGYTYFVESYEEVINRKYVRQRKTRYDN